MGIRDTAGFVLLALGALVLLWVYLRLAGRAAAAAWSHPERFPAGEWRWPEAVFTLGLAGFFLSVALASFGAKQEAVTLGSLRSGLAVYGAIVMLAFGFLIFRNNDLVELFGLDWRDWRDWRSGLPMAVGGLLLALPAVYAGQFAGYFFAGPEAQPQPIVDFLANNTDPAARWTVVLVGAIAAPVAEEVVFRGCLYGVLRQWWGRFAALVASSAAFALIHAHPASLPALFLLAAALVLLYEATGSLWAPIAAHALFNGLNIIATLQWPDLMK
jgi:membrane protease YdiL (CAAX protease family)